MDDDVTVSVLVVVRDGKDHLEECLKALLQQTFPRERYEVFIVDGMSTDGSREIAQRYVNRCPNFKLLDNPTRGYSAGLNLGIRSSDSDVIVKVDAHCVVASDFIERSVLCLEQTGAACVGGPITTVGEGFVGEAIAMVVSSPFGVGNARFRYSRQSGFVDTVPFGAYRRTVFDQVGLFDEKRARSEDLDLHLRIRSQGGRFFLHDSIRSRYFARQTVLGLMRQGMANGREVARYFEVASWRHLVPLAFVGTVMALSVTRALAGVGGGVLLFIVVVYGSVAVAFAAHNAMRKRFGPATLLPFLYVAWHVSYGIGSMIGVFDALVMRAGRAVRGKAA